MKANYLKVTVIALIMNLIGLSTVLAQTKMQYFRSIDQDGISQFEAPKVAGAEFDGIHVKVGGSSTLQFQGLSHESAEDSLVELSKNFNLATANLDLDVQLYQGVRMHLRTFLSSRHHTETYVKGGYLQIDELDFIKEDFLANVMEKVRIKVGHMEVNYGDAHFRRSDNASAMQNPFVGNFLMDSYTTEVAGEVYYFNKSIIAMIGVSNGRLNQSTTNVDTEPAYYGKLGFDRQLTDDLRFRLTGSFYTTNDNNSIYMYDGDRAGARYYHVMEKIGDGDNFRSGRIDPNYSLKMTSIMINPFLKYKGLEVFGMYENASGRHDRMDAAFTNNRSWNHIAGEVVYRIGEKEDVYLAARYNTTSGQLEGEENDKVSVNRLNLGGGWFLTKNILTKLEYVNQVYKDYPTGSMLNEGKFHGVMLEAAISF